MSTLLISDQSAVLEGGGSKKHFDVCLAFCDDSSFNDIEIGEIVPGADVLAACYDDFFEDTLTHIRNSLDTFKDSNLFATALLEVNFSNPLWKTYYQCYGIIRFLEGHSFSHITCQSDQAINDCVSAYCKINNIKCDTSTQAIRPWWFLARCILKSVRNMFYDLVYSFLLYRRKISPRVAPFLIYTRFPGNWVDSTRQQKTYRYFPASEVKWKPVSGPFEWTYLISLSRSNKPTVTAPWKALAERRILYEMVLDAPFRVAESYSSPRLVVWYYLSGWIRGIQLLVRWFRKRRHLCSVAYQALFFELCSESFIVDLPKNNLWGAVMTRCANTLNAKAVVSPVFELGEGRKTIESFNKNKTPTFGIQHGTFGPMHRFRCSLGPGEIAKYGGNANFLPNTIQVDGEFFARQWRQDFPDSIGLQNTGLMRLLHLPEVIQYEPKPGVYLVLLDMHFGKSLVKKCMILSKIHPFTFIVRPHPARYDEIKSFVDKHGSNDRICFDRKGTSLMESIQQNQPLAVIAGNTGAVVEVAYAMVPVVVFRAPDLPPISPLLFFPDVLSFRSTHQFDEALKRLMKDNFHIAYKDRCRRYAEQLATPFHTDFY